MVPQGFDRAGEREVAVELTAQFTGWLCHPFRQPLHATCTAVVLREQQGEIQQLLGQATAVEAGEDAAHGELHGIGHRLLECLQLLFDQALFLGGLGAGHLQHLQQGAVFTEGQMAGGRELLQPLPQPGQGLEAGLVALTHGVAEEHHRHLQRRDPQLAVLGCRQLLDRFKQLLATQQRSRQLLPQQAQLVAPGAFQQQIPQAQLPQCQQRAGATGQQQAVHTDPTRRHPLQRQQLLPPARQTRPQAQPLTRRQQFTDRSGQDAPCRAPPLDRGVDAPESGVDRFVVAGSLQPAEVHQPAPQGAAAAAGQDRRGRSQHRLLAGLAVKAEGPVGIERARARHELPQMALQAAAQAFGNAALDAAPLRQQWLQLGIHQQQHLVVLHD